MSVEINDLENTEIDTTYIDDIKSSRIEDFYIDNIVNIPLIKGEKGEKGDKGDKPVVGVDYYTEAEKTEFKNAVIQDSKTDIDEYTSSKKNEYNDNATEKIQEYDSNATSKTETFNTNAQNKIDEYNTNAESLINRIAGVESKNTEQDTNIANKVDKEAGKGLSSNDYTDAEKEKLASLSNYNDTEIKADITDIKAKNTEQDTNIANKVDKEAGKGLSSNDYTDAEKEKLASLSNYNDTEIKANITAIKSTDTEQDKKIAELEKENIKLRNQIPNGQASGNNIHLEDSSDLEIKWKLKGGHKQETTAGMQLLNPANLRASYTVNGLTFKNNNDGTFDINGTATANTTITLWNVKDIYEANHYFGLFSSVAYNNQNWNISLIITYTDGSSTQFITPSTPKNLTNENISSANISLYVENGTTLNQKSAKIMLYKDISTQVTEYERYTGAQPSPSPDYPSEIETVSGSVKIDVVNKNLFDIEQIELTSRTVSGVTVILNADNSITVNGTATANYNIEFIKQINYLNFYRNKTYSMLQQYISGNATDKLEAHFVFYNKEGASTWAWLDTKTQKTNSLSKKTALENGYTNKFVLYVKKGATYTNYTVKLMVAERDYTLDTILPYIDYQSQTAIMPIQQEMLEGDYIDDVEHHEWGKLVLTGNDFDYLVQQNKNGLNYFIFRQPLAKAKGRIISNMLKYNANMWTATQYTDCVRISSTQNIINIMLSDTTITTVAQFKTKLQELYNAGTPLIIYFESTTPINLELTTEQKAIREQKLHTYKNVTNISLSNDLASVDVSYKKDVETITKNCVQKEDGKGLSSNDYTDEEKEKLTNIEENAEVNIIESIKKNGAALDIEDKAIDIVVPTKTSELTNDSGFLDNTFSDSLFLYFSNNLTSKSDFENSNSFVLLTSSESQKKYTVATGGTLTIIELLTSIKNKNVASTSSTFNSQVAGGIGSTSLVEVSGAVKFYTTPKINCNINVGVFLKESDSETPMEIFSVDIVKSSIDSKVSACIPNICFLASGGSTVFLAFKCDEIGDYTIIQDEKSSFLKIKEIYRIASRPR